MLGVEKNHTVGQVDLAYTHNIRDSIRETIKIISMEEGTKEALCHGPVWVKSGPHVHTDQQIIFAGFVFE